jgi:hypothetical protein
MGTLVITVTISESFWIMICHRSNFILESFFVVCFANFAMFLFVYILLCFLYFFNFIFLGVYFYLVVNLFIELNFH